MYQFYNPFTPSLPPISPFPSQYIAYGKWRCSEDIKSRLSGDALKRYERLEKAGDIAELVAKHGWEYVLNHFG